MGSAQASPRSVKTLANPKAAYRFLSNERVSEAAILAGHCQSTRDRCLAEPEPVLILHDTTGFNFKREPIGLLSKGAGQTAKDACGTLTSCGLLMQASLT